MVRTGALWMALALLGASVNAQPLAPRFEVAAIRPTVPVTSGRLDALVRAIFPRFEAGGLFTAHQVTTHQLMMLAYDLRPNRIVGGSEWMRADHFEIRAKAATDAPASQMKLMIQSLLADRFKLVAHMEAREMRYQALVQARANGRLGPELQPLSDCNSAIVGELRRTFPDRYPFPMGAGMVSSCSKAGVEALAAYLDSRLGVPVIDETGLTGSFYYTIRSQWPAGPSRAEVSDPDLPALPTALEDQLGLRLEPRKGPITVLVVDSAQPPTEN